MQREPSNLEARALLYVESVLRLSVVYEASTQRLKERRRGLQSGGQALSWTWSLYRGCRSAEESTQFRGQALPCMYSQYRSSPVCIEAVQGGYPEERGLPYAWQAPSCISNQSRKAIQMRKVSNMEGKLSLSLSLVCRVST